MGVRSFFRVGMMLAVTLGAGTAAAQTTVASQAAVAPAFSYPAEGTNPLASAKAALGPCSMGAISQTWHMSCVIQAIWGSGHTHSSHPPAHSAAFVSAAMAEAVAQTTRYKTRENMVYRQVARQFAGARQEVSYTAFLDAAGQAFRRLPREDVRNMVASAQ